MRILSRKLVNLDTLADAVGATAIFATLGAVLWILHGLGLSGL